MGSVIYIYMGSMKSFREDLLAFQGDNNDKKTSTN